MMSATNHRPGPPRREEHAAPKLRPARRRRLVISDRDRKLANYRALLDHEAALTVAAAWIDDTQRERKQLERRLGQHVPGDRLTKEQVKAMVKALKDIVSVLADAEPAEKTELYDQLGISLVYNANGTVTVESRPRGVQVCVGGAKRTLNPRALGSTSYTVA
jgi:site-specific DNA recombinase